MHPIFIGLNYVGKLEKSLSEDVYGEYKFTLSKEIQAKIETVKQLIEQDTSPETQKKHIAMLNAYTASLEVIEVVWAKFNG